jgi:hypothetical protein
MRSWHGVRVEGPLEPCKGNVYEPVIRQSNGAILILNPCTYGLAISFCKRWNEKTRTDEAHVRFIGARETEQST